MFLGLYQLNRTEFFTQLHTTWEEPFRDSLDMCSYQEEGDEPAHDAAFLQTPVVRTECRVWETAAVLYSVVNPKFG